MPQEKLKTKSNGGRGCYVRGASTVIDYGIGAGADSIMPCLDTIGENLVNCQGQLGTARVQLYWIYTTMFSLA